MKDCTVRGFMLLALLCIARPSVAQPTRFKMLAFYSAKTEPDHVQFADGALRFLAACAANDGFTFESTTNWEQMNDTYLKAYQVVVWLDDAPATAEQRGAFERYMKNGGAWLGFHASGYNDKDTKGPWFVDFMGGAVFHINSWPPLPAKLVMDDRTHPIASGIPDSYESPANEWYVWKPSPRLDRNVRVLATFDPSNYPLGFKDVLTGGDLPAVWTNTKYKMIYMNMGHGDKIFTSPIQNKLIENAATWLGRGSVAAAFVPPSGTEISPHGIALDPETHKVYAVNTAAGTVAVLDGAGHSASTIKVGTEPEAIAINPITHRVYVANSGSGSVSVIDGTTDNIVATVNVGDLPYVVAVNPATGKVYISRTFSSDMTVIDGTSNVTSTLKAGVQADAIVVNPVANRIYLISYESNNVTVIDGANESFTTVAAGTHLWGIAVNSATNRIYLTNAGSSNVTVIDGKTNAVSRVDTGDIPCAIALDSSTGRVYAVNYASGSVTVMDGVTNSVVATISVGSRPQAIAVDSGAHRVYVASTHDNIVAVIDGASNSLAATLKVDSGPFAMAADDVTGKIFVNDLAGVSPTVIDGRTLTVSTAVSAP